MKMSGLENGAFFNFARTLQIGHPCPDPHPVPADVFDEFAEIQEAFFECRSFFTLPKRDSGPTSHPDVVRTAAQLQVERCASWSASTDVCRTSRLCSSRHAPWGVRPGSRRAADQFRCVQAPLRPKPCVSEGSFRAKLLSVFHDCVCPVNRACPNGVRGLQASRHWVSVRVRLHFDEVSVCLGAAWDLLGLRLGFAAALRARASPVLFAVRGSRHGVGSLASRESLETCDRSVNQHPCTALGVCGCCPPDTATLVSNCQGVKVFVTRLRGFLLLTAWPLLALIANLQSRSVAGVGAPCRALSDSLDSIAATLSSDPLGVSIQSRLEDPQRQDQEKEEKGWWMGRLRSGEGRRRRERGEGTWDLGGH